MQQIFGAAGATIGGVQTTLSDFAEHMTNTQILVGFGALLLVAVLLLVLYLVTSSKYRDALEQIDRHIDDILQVKKEAQELVLERQRELEQRQAEVAEQLEAKRRKSEEQYRRQQQEIDSKHAEFERLRQFHEEYKVVGDAKVEVRRLLKQAQESAAGIIADAQRQAGVVREMSDQLLSTSMETIKSLLDQTDPQPAASEPAEPAATEPPEVRPPQQAAAIPYEGPVFPVAEPVNPSTDSYN